MQKRLQEDDDILEIAGRTMKAAKQTVSSGRADTPGEVHLISPFFLCLLPAEDSRVATCKVTVRLGTGCLDDLKAILLGSPCLLLLEASMAQLPLPLDPSLLLPSLCRKPRGVTGDAEGHQ